MTTPDDVEISCQAHMRTTIITAIQEMEWPQVPANCVAAANAGHVYGMADAVVHLIAMGSTNPDLVAHKIADYIRVRVAYYTSCGGIT